MTTQASSPHGRKMHLGKVGARCSAAPSCAPQPHPCAARNTLSGTHTAASRQNAEEEGWHHSGPAARGAELRWRAQCFISVSCVLTLAVIFRESVYVGDTDYSQDEIHQLMLKMGQEYKGNRYHLLQRNCNHFASDVVYQLTGHHAPQWVSGLRKQYT